ncbi:FadR/GntR family transcriptional regulator [Ruegeria jejuensis]|uniref:FadR/GntR family transcriptional regulator n=1 Tax=Ruegeria jejuensis TaxID=3233338 RepID=UPI00355B6A93
MATKTYQRVANSLESDIRSGKFKPMSRLPPERELASDFEVSRTTVREALLALEAARIITIKDRSGAYVLPISDEESTLLARVESTPGPHEVLQLRRLIEPEACFQVAMSGSDAIIADIVAAYEANAAVPPDDTPEFHQSVRHYHMTIMKGAGNSLFVELMDYLWEQKSGPLWENWYMGTRSRHHRQTTIANNREITEVIVARRPQAARTAMERHIDGMVSRFLSY